MPTTQLSSFYDYVIPDAPGVALAAVDHAVRSAARKFCNDYQLLTETLADITLVADTATYPLLPTEASEEIAEILKIIYIDADGNERKITPRSEDYLNLWNPLWDTLTGEPLTGLLQDELLLRVVPYPTTDTPIGTVRVKIARRPVYNASVVDLQLLSKYHEPIKHLALMNLKMQAQKPYTDLPGAEIHGRLYRSTAGDAWRRNRRGGAHAEQVVIPRIT